MPESHANPEARDWGDSPPQTAQTQSRRTVPPKSNTLTLAEVRLKENEKPKTTNVH